MAEPSRRRGPRRRTGRGARPGRTRALDTDVVGGFLADDLAGTRDSVLPQGLPNEDAPVPFEHGQERLRLRRDRCREGPRCSFAHGRNLGEATAHTATATGAGSRTAVHLRLRK
ncbi:hypothetical protein NOCARDAX2BIS_180016 [Nocardioides sp. AX2bis]|nr:hypothetical protein NOCARDAX2BIS_180016 [Nocardioides sp. AX2bis]